MIKFFRKIRQPLLSEGKIKKYLKYAVGEIVLVFIGILIALQLNEWNRKIQDLKLSTLYYQELLRDVENDVKQLTGRIERSQLTKLSIDSLISSLQNKTYGQADQKILQRAFNSYYRVPGWQLNLNTYNELESSGNLKYISNNEIRDAISEYANAIKAASIVRERYSEDIISRAFHIDKYVFTKITDDRLISIIDFEGLANDQHIINYLSRIAIRWDNNRSSFEGLKRRAQRIEKSILVQLE